MRGQDEIPTAYGEAGLVLVEAAAEKPRDVFAYIIHEGKVRAPQGAMALAERTR